MSAMGLTGLKLSCWQGRVPSGGSRGAFIYLPFQLLEAARIPWLQAPIHLHSQG